MYLTFSRLYYIPLLNVNQFEGIYISKVTDIINTEQYMCAKRYKL